MSSRGGGGEGGAIGRTITTGDDITIALIFIAIGRRQNSS